MKFGWTICEFEAVQSSAERGTTVSSLIFRYNADGSSDVAIIQGPGYAGYTTVYDYVSG